MTTTTSEPAPFEVIARKYLTRFGSEGPHGFIDREWPALAKVIADAVEAADTTMLHGHTPPAGTPAQTLVDRVEAETGKPMQDRTGVVTRALAAEAGHRASEASACYVPGRISERPALICARGTVGCIASTHAPHRSEADVRSNEVPPDRKRIVFDEHGITVVGVVSRDDLEEVAAMIGLDVARVDNPPAETSDQAKYYVKARVYGAIAAEYQRALERITTESSLYVGFSKQIAKDALAWRHSEKGGVPRAAVDEIGALLAPCSDYASCAHPVVNPNGTCTLCGASALPSRLADRPAIRERVRTKPALLERAGHPDGLHLAAQGIETITHRVVGPAREDAESANRDLRALLAPFEIDASEADATPPDCAPWVTVIMREQRAEVLPWADETSARNYFDPAQAQWSEAWLCRVVVGPRDVMGMRHPPDAQRTERLQESERLLRFYRFGMPGGGSVGTWTEAQRATADHFIDDVDAWLAGVPPEGPDPSPRPGTCIACGSSGRPLVKGRPLCDDAIACSSTELRKLARGGWRSRPVKP